MQDRRPARGAEGARQAEDRPVEISALDRCGRQPAEDGDRKDPAVQAAGWCIVIPRRHGARLDPNIRGLLLRRRVGESANTRMPGSCVRVRRDDQREDATSRSLRKANMTNLSPSGFLTIGTTELEYRMVGPAPDQAPTIVMLHEGLGCVGLWGDFPDKLQAATGAACSSIRAPATAPRRRSRCRARSITCTSRRSRCCRSCSTQIGFRRGLLVGHSDGASIAAIYAGGVRIIACGRGADRAAFIVEDISVASIAAIRTGLRDRRS